MHSFIAPDALNFPRPKYQFNWWKILMDHFSPSYFALLNPQDPGKLAKNVITGPRFRILQVLTDARVHYMITGDLAMTLLGVFRLSSDLELLVEPEEENIRRLCDSLAPEINGQGGIHSLLPDPGYREYLSVCFENVDGVRIGIFADPTIPFDTVYERRTRIPTGSMIIDVVSLEDLVLIKSASDRPVDQADAKMLRKALEERKEA